MSDSIAETSEEVVDESIDVEGLEQLPNPDPNGGDVPENDQSIVDFLKSKSPEKGLEEYQGHTLDFDERDSTRRLIRGLEGLLGATNYAVADIVIGLAQKISGLQDSGQDEEWNV